MRARILVGLVVLSAVGGCGLEGAFSNGFHTAYDKPATALTGAAAWSGASGSQLGGIDANGQALVPFAASAGGGRYLAKFESSSYDFLRVQARAGDMLLRRIVPTIGKETTLPGMDLDARSTTEALIVEARLGKMGVGFNQLTPAAYTGTQALIRAGFDTAGPIQTLLKMVERLMAAANPATSAPEASLFRVPAFTKQTDGTYLLTSSPLDTSWLSRNETDYDGDGIFEHDPVDFDAALLAAAALYDPTGCLDPGHIRLVFSVDFNPGALDGAGQTVNRFRWAPDKPGKSMFFVGWVHLESEVQDPAIANLVGNASPNQIPMYDDGTHGDETTGDGIWTVAFSVPFDAAKKLRLGYKYTWGTLGAGWGGTEEWPGNSRLLEVVDVNGDGFVHRRDVFMDEASNKDKSNSNPRAPQGAVTWTTAIHGDACGAEVHERKVTLHDASRCDDPPPPGLGWVTPTTIGPVKVSCPVD